MPAPPAIEARGSRIYLRLPPEPFEPLSAVVARVRQELPGLGIDWVAVREAYKYGRGRPFPIADRDPEATGAEKAKIRFSRDGLTAYLILYPPKGRGRRLTEAQVLELAAAYGVPRDLIDPDALRRALLRRSYLEPEPFARGRPPEDGEPARMRWAGGIPVDPGSFLQALEAGREVPDPVLLLVRPGDAAGALQPAGRGTHGLSARGEPIPARPGANPVRLGRGLGIAPDGRTVVAQAQGHLRITGPGGIRAEVLPVLRAADPAELAPWRDRFYPGSVVIEGDLEVPFPVRVLGDMEIRGSLIRSPVEVLGSLFVRDGIIQARTVPVQVGGVVSAGFVERARVVAHTVHVRRYVLKGSITALHTVWVADPGDIRGGQTVAGRRITAGEIGNPNALSTEVAVGMAPLAAAFEKLYRSWARRLEEEKPADEGPDPAEAAQRWAERAAAVEPPDPLAALISARKVHPGVTVRMGSAVRTLESPIGPVDFSFERFGARGRVALARR